MLIARGNAPGELTVPSVNSFELQPQTSLAPAHEWQQKALTFHVY